MPRHAFDEVLEENGWIFLREGDVLVALKLLGVHEWTTEGEWKGVEVRSPGAKNGAVCEAARLGDFASFEAFRQEIASNEIVFDASKMRLSYSSTRAGRLFLDTKGTRRHNGERVDLDYGTYDSPFMQSDWGSGVIEIRKGERRLLLDFTR